jgi:ribosomal protein L37AE/L43A/transposase-like protein
MRKGVGVPKEMSIIEFFEKFGSNEQCRKDLWEKRLVIGFECPKCNSRDGYELETKYLWQCKNCGHQVSLTAGTAFDNTKIGLQKWYLAAFFILSSKAGISAKELQHQIRVTYKTAWYVNRRLRDAMRLANDKYKLGGIVAMDEAYFTGRKTAEGADKKRGRGTNKSKVIVAVSLTGEGKPMYARMQVADNFKAKTIEKFAESYIEKGSKIVTDGFQSYKSQKIQKDYFVDYDMMPADDEDSKMKWLHTVISNAKAFILGTFHGLKADDLQVYLDEFCYRFNRRYMRHLMFDKLINSAITTPPMGYYRTDDS